MDIAMGVIILIGIGLVISLYLEGKGK